MTPKEYEAWRNVSRDDWIVYWNNLNKPSWTPPPIVFSIVWSILYPIIAVTFGYIFYESYVKETLDVKYAHPFVWNLSLNLFFNVTFFLFRSQQLSLAVVMGTLATLVISMWQIYPVYAWVAYANIPHLIWLCTATTLQLGICSLNQ